MYKSVFVCVSVSTYFVNNISKNKINIGCSKSVSNTNKIARYRFPMQPFAFLPFS